MYKLVDSTKCRLQTDCRPLFSGLENNGTISGFIAQLVRASHRYREVTGSNPVEVLFFIFSGFLRNCINCVHNREDHSSFDFISAVSYMMYFICICQWDYCRHVLICMVKKKQCFAMKAVCSLYFVLMLYSKNGRVRSYIFRSQPKQVLI